MKLAIEGGGSLTVPRNTRVAGLREALIRMGYLPVCGPRGRIVLQRLH